MQSVGAKEVKENQSTATIKKYVKCFKALGMEVQEYELGGGQRYIIGTIDKLRLAADVRFNMGETATGKLSSSFDSAKVKDPIGVVRNLCADYSINKVEAKRVGITTQHASKISNMRSLEYNDGSQYAVNVSNFYTASDFNEWLDDWISLLKIDHKSMSAKKRATKEERNNLAIMNGGLWEE